MVQGPTYEIEAKLSLDEQGQARRRAEDLQRQLQRVATQLRGSERAAVGMTRNLIAAGASYLGFRTLLGTTTGLVRQQVEYASALEGTRIGLASVMSVATGGALSLAQAGRVSEQVFDQLRNDALKSVGTAHDLFDTYQAIVGPVLQAGKGLKDVRQLTNDSVNAAAALNVDFGQAKRDMGLMVRGAAGLDVKLFAMLRSTGAIAETTEQWNKSLTGTQRVEKLQAALAKFRPAAEQYAKSWRGVTSSFKDISNELGRSGMQPVLNAASRGLGRINALLLQNQKELEGRMRAWGERTAGVIDRVFDKAISGTQYVVEHWDELLARGEKFAALMVTAAKAVAVYQGVGIARNVAASGVEGVAGVSGLLEAMGLAGAARGSGGRGGAFDNAMGSALKGSRFAGDGDSLDLARRASMFGNPLAAGAGAASGGAGAAGGVALGPIIAIGVALAALAAGAAAAYAEMAPMREAIAVVGAMAGGFGGELLELGKAIGNALMPVLKMFGSVFGQVMVVQLGLALAALRPLVAGLTWLINLFGKLTSYIWERVKPAHEALWTLIKDFFELFSLGADQLFGASEKVKSALFNMESAHPGMKPKELFDASRGRRFNSVTGQYETVESEPYVPVARSQTTYDFRGSKIEVKQSFRDADPDRVLVQMVNALGREAEMRTQSGFVPALTR